MFKDKTLLITGGTGSFGGVALERFINTDMGKFVSLVVMKQSSMT